MSDEKQERRVNLEDLPEPEQELTTEEAKDIKGGIPAVQKIRSPAAKTDTQSSAQSNSGNVVAGNLIGTD